MSRTRWCVDCGYTTTTEDERAAKQEHHDKGDPTHKPRWMSAAVAPDITYQPDAQVSPVRATPAEPRQPDRPKLEKRPTGGTKYDDLSLERPLPGDGIGAVRAPAPRGERQPPVSRVTPAPEGGPGSSEAGGQSSEVRGSALAHLPRIMFGHGEWVAYERPKSSMDLRAQACTNHHPACDCREGQFSEWERESRDSWDAVWRMYDLLGDLMKLHNADGGGCRVCITRGPCGTLVIVREARRHLQ